MLLLLRSIHATLKYKNKTIHITSKIIQINSSSIKIAKCKNVVSVFAHRIITCEKKNEKLF